jgi:hypothetical protein
VRCLGHKPRGENDVRPEGSSDPSGWYSLSAACRRCQNCVDPGTPPEPGYAWKDDGHIPCWVEGEVPNLPPEKVFRRLPPAHVLAWHEGL